MDTRGGTEVGKCVGCGAIRPRSRLGFCFCCNNYLCDDCRTVHPYGWMICSECLAEELEVLAGLAHPSEPADEAPVVLSASSQE